MNLLSSFRGEVSSIRVSIWFSYEGRKPFVMNRISDRSANSLSLSSLFIVEGSPLWASSCQLLHYYTATSSTNYFSQPLISNKASSTALWTVHLNFTFSIVLRQARCFINCFLGIFVNIFWKNVSCRCPVSSSAFTTEATFSFCTTNTKCLLVFTDPSDNSFMTALKSKLMSNLVCQCLPP